jgi:hypothetical protein
MNRNHLRRIDELESRAGLTGTDGWQVITYVMIGGMDRGFSFAEHIKTGQRSYDPAFIEQVSAATKAKPSRLPADNVRLIIGDDPEYDSLVQEAIAAGAIERT